MPATAILQCTANSHPFPDRTLMLDEPVKIGRSVARARSAANNAIFDCKVLSRNHALLWYDDGKFYLKDTKSSNGTFVNNYRLSKGSEESSPQEVCSGDMVQFGVDVMENSKKGTVTHGCIIATLKLYLPDGHEAKASFSTSVPSGLCSISSQELYQLRISLQEAQHREHLIETKLASFQQLITSIQEAASQSWTAMIDEDRLLQRLETLEDQLNTYAKNCPEDATREEIRRILEEKSRYETSAKESLQRILKEKVDAVTKCVELERILSVTKTELNQKQEAAEAAHNQLQDLLSKQTAQTSELKKMTEKLKSTEDSLNNSKEKSNSELRELETKLQEKCSDEKNLLVKVESLKAENDFTKEQLSAIKAKYENIKNGRLSLGAIVGTDLKEFEFSDEEVKKSFQLFRTAVQALQERLWQAKEELHQTQAAITQLKGEAEAADKADVKCQTTKAQLQEELSEKKAKEEANAALIDHLQSQLGVLQARLRDLSPDSPKIYEDIYEDVTLCKFKKRAKEAAPEDSNKDETNEPEDTNEKDDDSDSLSDSTLTLIPNDVVDKNSLNGTDKNRFNLNSESVIFLREDITKLQDILSLAEASKSSAAEEVKRIREEVARASTAALTAAHEAANLHHVLAENEALLMERTRYVSTLQEVGGQLESSIDLIYSHLNALTQRIAQEKQETLASNTENKELKEKLHQAELLSQEGLQQMETLRAKLNSLESLESDLQKDARETLNHVESPPTDSRVSLQSPVENTLPQSSPTPKEGENLTPSLSSSSSSRISPSRDEGDKVTAPSSTLSPAPSKEESSSSEAEENLPPAAIPPQLEEEMRQLRKAYNDVKENEARLKEQLAAQTTLKTSLSNNCESSSVVPSSDLQSVEALKLELKNLLEEHSRLKQKLILSDAEFRDLNLQNKVNGIPTWLMLTIVVSLAVGWQWISSLF